MKKQIPAYVISYEDNHGNLVTRQFMDEDMVFSCRKYVKTLGFTNITIEYTWIEE